MNSRYLIAQIVADGWYLVRVKGNHHPFKHPTKPGLVTVPHPKKDLLTKTAISIFAADPAELSGHTAFAEDNKHALPNRDFNG